MLINNLSGVKWSNLSKDNIADIHDTHTNFLKSANFLEKKFFDKQYLIIRYSTQDKKKMDLHLESAAWLFFHPMIYWETRSLISQLSSGNLTSTHIDVVEQYFSTIEKHEEADNSTSHTFRVASGRQTTPIVLTSKNSSDSKQQDKVNDSRTKPESQPKEQIQRQCQTKKKIKASHTTQEEEKIKAKSRTKDEIVHLFLKKQNSVFDASSQMNTYDLAKRELETGRKIKCWIWYIFPSDIKFLDKKSQSPMSQEYGLRSEVEAQHFWKCQELRTRYITMVKLVLKNFKAKSSTDSRLKWETVIQVLSKYIDVKKFNDSLLIFHCYAEDNDLTIIEEVISYLQPLSVDIYKETCDGTILNKEYTINDVVLSTK